MPMRGLYREIDVDNHKMGWKLDKIEQCWVELTLNLNPFVLAV